MHNVTARDLVGLSFLVALGIVLHLVEDLLPVQFLTLFPGVKIGFANIVTVVALFRWQWQHAFLVAILRIVLGSLLGGNFLNIGFFLSLGGGLASVPVMALCRSRQLSPVAVSIPGAFVHTTGQVVIASIYLGTPAVFWYLTFLGPLAVLSGLFTGYLAGLLLRQWKRKVVMGDQ